jgi:prepilin-type N-terminal cleavage/methylation domain-containing protein
MMKNKGFTLIELLIVIALIAVIAGAVIIALNPARQFASARNSQRWSHLPAILNAIQQNISENQGTFTCAEGAIPAVATAMSAAGYDICACLIPNYVSSMPFDPSDGSYASCADYDTGYTILQDGDTGRITVAAPSAELGAVISSTQCTRMRNSLNKPKPCTWFCYS